MSLAPALVRRRAVRRTEPPSRRRLVAAVAALFAFDGFVFGSWAARIPDVTEQVGTSHAGLGVALLCVSVGALASMQLTGALCARLGAGLVAAAGSLLLCVAVALPGSATTLPELAAALLVFGAVTGTVNVAANSAGVRAETGGDRPLLPALHAAFSFGGLAGAAGGGLASALGPVAPHLLAVGAVGLAVTAVIAPTLLAADGARAPGSADEDAARGPRTLLVLLGVIAGCTAYGEGALTDWGALHLRETLQATPALAAAGYAGFSLAMACGRLAGGHLVRAWGTTPLLVGGSLLAALGMLAAALAPTVGVALAGFTLVGLGLANVFPLAIGRAGALGGPNGVAVASTVGYSGLLAGPPLIGFLVEALGLPGALTTVSLLAVVAAVLSVAVSPAPAGRLLDAAQDRLLAAAVPVVARYGPPVRRFAADLALLGPAPARVAPGVVTA